VRVAGRLAEPSADGLRADEIDLDVGRGVDVAVDAVHGERDGNRVPLHEPPHRWRKAPSDRQVFLLNVAVTDFAAVIVTVHAPVPEHAPLHPANTDPSAALGLRFTTTPFA
jgi:hypothetical protein